MTRSSNRADLRRRALVFGAPLLAAPLHAIAQQRARTWRVGYLSLTALPPGGLEERSSAFLRGMRDLGYVEGSNLVVERRFAGNNMATLAAMAAELVELKVDVIVTAGVPPTAAAKKATSTLPIVMGTSTDAVASGLVSSLAQPGGNITGQTNVAVDLGPKHLDILATIVPKAARIALLLNPDTASHEAIHKSTASAAQKIKVAIVALQATTVADIDQAFIAMQREQVGGLIVPIAPLFSQQQSHIARLALKHRLPSISGFTDYAEAGGLIGYGPDLPAHFYRAATFVDKIFRGARPANLPIEQPTHFETVVNRQTARALGIALPESLLLQASKLIG